MSTTKAKRAMSLVTMRHVWHCQRSTGTFLTTGSDTEEHLLSQRKGLEINNFKVSFPFQSRHLTTFLHLEILGLCQGNFQVRFESLGCNQRPAGPGDEHQPSQRNCRPRCSGSADVSRHSDAGHKTSEASESQDLHRQ